MESSSDCIFIYKLNEKFAMKLIYAMDLFSATELTINNIKRFVPISTEVNVAICDAASFP